MRVGEKICFEIVKTGDLDIYFGFSAVDPGELAGHWRWKPGFFTGKLDEELEGSVIDYHLTSSGEVMYRVNGEEKGVFFSVGNKKTSLWGMMFPWGDKKIKLLHSS